MAIRLYATESCIVKDTVPPFKTNTAASVSNTSSPAVTAEKIAILFKVEDLAQEYYFKKIAEMKVGVYHNTSFSYQGGPASVHIQASLSVLAAPYDYSSASYVVPTKGINYHIYGFDLSNYGVWPSSISEYAISEPYRSLGVSPGQMLSNGFFMRWLVDYDKKENVLTTIHSSDSNQKPYVDIEFSNVTPYLVPKSSFPRAGDIVNSGRNITVNFGFDTSHANFDYVGDLYAGTAKLKWRNGASGTVHTISVSTLSGEIPVPAGTFPRSEDLQYQIEITDGGGTTSSTDWISFSTDLQLYASNLSPSGGYVDETKVKTFSWRLSANNSDELDALTENASVQLQWRASPSAAVNNIDASSLYSINVPADTFPSTGTPQWRVAVTDSYGNVTYSDWIAFTTTDSIGTATPVSPINTIVSGAESKVFSWTYNSATGSAPSGAVLQRSSDGSTWENLKTVSGSETNTLVDLSSFSGGQFYWRVQANNNDGEAGPWSDPVSFVLLAAPLTPTVTASQTPRPDVSWQATGQQAYQIVIDGLFDSGSIFGTEKNYKLPILLPDGQHLIKVRVQNSFGIWSEFGAAAVYVSNVPGVEIELRADRSAFDVSLSWTGGEYSRYLVRRNGQIIGLTIEQNFTDLSALGNAEYSVIGIDDSTDNYAESNTAAVFMCINGPVITAMDNHQWISLRLSSESSRKITYNKTRNVTYRHVYGAEYPVAEFSNERDEYISFSTAMADCQESDLFESLVGKKVILKTKDGVYTGILEATKASGSFFREFNCSIRTVYSGEDYSL